MERPEGSDEMPPGFNAPSEPEPSSSKPTPAPKSSAAPEPKSEPKETQEEPMEVDEGEDEEKKAKAEGNVAYKARKFEEAIGLYEKAWDLYPKDVTFLTNLSGEWCRL
jgi:stress-induced-phosphoprotein 1